MHTIIAVDNNQHVGIGYVDGRPARYIRDGMISPMLAQEYDTAIINGAVWIVVNGQWLRAGSVDERTIIIHVNGCALIITD